MASEIVLCITVFDELLLRDALEALSQCSVFHDQDHVLLFKKFNSSCNFNSFCLLHETLKKDGKLCVLQCKHDIIY